MNDVLGAIVARYNAATAITANGIYLDVAADGAAEPYGVLKVMPASRHDPRFGDNQDDTYNVRFVLVDDSFADVVTLQNNLHARFDRHRLSGVTEPFPMIRTNQYVAWTGTTDKDGNKLYMAVSDYRTAARRTLA